MRIRLNKLMFVLLLLSTMFSGIAWEIIGWASILMAFFFSPRTMIDLTEKKARKLALFWIIVYSIYYIFQIRLLHLDYASAIRLYGITKTTIACSVMVMFLINYGKEYDLIEDALPILLFVDWLTIIALITRNQSLNILGGSQNYLGAVNGIILIYQFKFADKTKNKILRYMYFITMISMVLFSGSRTLIIITVIAFASVLVLEPNIKTKFKYIFIAIIILGIGLLFATNIGIANELVLRGLSVFKNLNDESRTGLQFFAQQQMSRYSDLEILIGNGNNLVIAHNKPAHNVVLEILLCYGRIGLGIWIAYVISWVFFILKNFEDVKAYAISVLILALIIGMVQPFITSGYLFQMLVCFTMIQIYYRKKALREET